MDVIDSGTLLQDRFLIGEKIGMGGMGAVYRAVDQKFGSQVAIKETFYGDTHLAEAFEREARLLNGLHHPIMPHVSDYFSENGGHFLVMEYIEGEDLSEILKRGEIFPVNTVLGWTLDLLDGIDYLHSQDPPIIHRDIKPNNLKLTSRGKIVLLDFGMAKETSQNTLGAKSVFGYSRRYSPLEQIEGAGTDVRSDIFSLGATVYHLITGKPPVDALARASAIVAGRPDPVVPANAINPEVPEPVAAILNAALALNPDYRFESAHAMANALEYAIDAYPIAQSTENHSQSAQVDTGSSLEESAYAGAVIGASALAAAGQETAWSDLYDDTEQLPAENGPVVSSNEEAAAPMPAGVTVPTTLSGGSFIDRTLRSPGLRQKITSALPIKAIAPILIRKTGRPGYVYWVPVLILCMAFVLFGTYRGLTRQDEDAADIVAGPATNPASAEDTEISPQTELVDSGTEEIPEEALPEMSESQTDIAESSDEAETAPRAGDNVINLRKGPIATNRIEPNRRAATESKQATRVSPAPNAVRPSSRPVQKKQAGNQTARKAVTPAFARPSVSSIEAIFTGVPYEQRRQWEDDERARWIEEDLRRRRFRRMMRQNRRRMEPF